jgi:hypothetical protein
LISQASVFGLLWLYGRNFARRWRREEEFEISWASIPVPSEIVASTPFTAQDRPNSARRYWHGSPKWFKGHPVTWLTLREMSMHSTGGVWIAGAIICAAFAFTRIGPLYAAVYSFGLSVVLCIASARTFATARQSNSMELLVTTPLGVEGVIEGHMRALRKMFLWPGVIMVGTFALLLLDQKYGAGFSGNDTWNPEGNAFNWYVLSGFALLLLATPWIGMWMGLRSKTPARAVLATLSIVLILPRLGGCILIDAIYFALLCVFARDRVYDEFRKMIPGRGDAF